MIQPETSRLANHKMNDTGTKESHYSIIYNALMSMPNSMGTATDIALRCKVDYVATNRRLGEMVGSGMIEIFSNRGGKTRTGNPCRVYRAISQEQEQPIQQPHQQIDLFNAA